LSSVFFFRADRYLVCRECCPPGCHGSLRSRLRAAATSGSKHGCCKVHSELAQPSGPTASAAVIRTFAPKGIPTPRCVVQSSAYAEASTLDARKGSPERQTACSMTDSLRAGAMRALPLPDFRAIAIAQLFNGKSRLIRVRMTTAASYISVRARPSPHREIRPLRSTSPDWY